MKNGKIWAFIFPFIFLFPLSAKPTFLIENLDTSQFPKVELSLRENYPHSLTSHNLVITEEMDGVRTIPQDLQVERPPGKEPIQLVLSIQPTDSPSINQWSVDLAVGLSSLLEPGDRFHVHIQEEKRFLFLKNQTYNSLKSGLVIPSQDTYTKTLSTISVLLDNLALSGNKPPFLLVLLHSKTIPDKHMLVDLSKKARRMGIPIQILGFPSSDAEKLAEYSDGKLYSLKEKDSTNQVFEDIEFYKKPPYKISYNSRKDVSLFDEKYIQIDLGILNIQNLSTDYSINFFTRLENGIRNPYVFIPSAFFFFVICVSALIILPRVKRRNTPSDRESMFIPGKEKLSVSDNSDPSGYPVLRTGKEVEESRVYEKMYGKKEENSSSMSSRGSYYDAEEDWEYDTESQSFMEPVQGESYSKAVLIQKEGPSPGRQYNLYGHETLIGRLETNQLVIYDNTLSPVHARIKNIQNKFVIYDMLSLSGVYLNGKKLLRPKVLQDFDEILMGKTLLIFRGK